MADTPPAPNDSLGSLFDLFGWFYARAWPGIAALWAVIMLPAELVVVAVKLGAGLATPQAFAEAIKARDFAPALAFAAVQALFLAAVFVHAWAVTAFAEAVFRGSATPVADSLRLVASTVLAQLWSFVSVMARLLPCVFLAGIAAALCGRLVPVVSILIILATAIAAPYFLTRWLLVSAVVLFEGVSGSEALRRSVALTSRRLGLFALHFYAFNIVTVVGSLVMGLLIGLASVKAGFPNAGGAVAGAAGAMTFGPMAAALFVGMYRREIVAEKGTPWPAPAGPA